MDGRVAFSLGKGGACGPDCWSAFSDWHLTCPGRCPSRSWKLLKCHLFVAWTLTPGRTHVTTGLEYFWQWGWGLCGEASTMPLWDRQLGRPAPLPQLAVGSQVWYGQPLIPTLRVPKADSTHRELP